MGKILNIIKDNKMKSIVISMLIIVTILGISMAIFFVTGGSENEKSVTFANLKISFQDGETVNNSNNLPIREDQVEQLASKSTFTAENVGNADAYVDIALTGITIDDALKNEYFRWTVYESGVQVETGNFSNVGTSMTLVRDLILPVNESREYTLYIWILDNDGDQNEMLNKAFNAKIQVTGVEKALYLATSEGSTLTFNNTSAGKSLRGFTLTGNSVQDGTPTPTSPIEVESVGDKTVNLFDGFTVGLGLNSTTGVEVSNANSATSDFIEVDFNENTNYMVSGLNSSIRSYIAAYNNDKEFLGRTGAIRVASLLLTADKFTAGTAQGTGDIKYIRVTQYVYDETGVDINDIGDFNVQVETGSTASSYEPYGYKIPITISGKNLFNLSSAIFGGDTGKVVETGTNYFVAQVDLDNSSATNKTPGGKVWSSGWATMKISNLEIGKKYTLSYDAEVLEQLVEYSFPIKQKILDNNSTIETDSTVSNEVQITGLNTIARNRIVFTALSEQAIFTLTCNSSKIKFSNIQLEEGSIDTTYEIYQSPTTYTIYLDEPLRKVESYSDYIDFTNKQIVRNIKEISLKGTESFALETSLETVGRYRLWISDYPSISIPNGLSTHYNFVANYALSEEHFYMQNTALRIFSSYLTVDEFKGWLSTQYSDGTPVTIDYILSTLDIDDIDLPDIKTVDGTTIVSVDTAISPTLSASVEANK